MNKESVIRKELLNNLTDENVKLLTEEEVKYLYYNQYDEELNLPSVDRVKEEGNWVYKIYCYGGYSKYYCKVFEDPTDPFHEALFQME
jgi:hypothetical protein